MAWFRLLEQSISPVLSDHLREDQALNSSLRMLVLVDVVENGSSWSE